VTILLIVSTFSFLDHFLALSSFGTTNTRRQQPLFLNYSSGVRILHQDVPTIEAAKWRKSIRQQQQHLFFQKAHCDVTPKPMMMGFLLVPTEDGIAANYNINRKHSHQLDPLLAQPRRYYEQEKFDTVEIHPEHHSVVNGKPDTKWTYDHKKVIPLGLGTERQYDIDNNSKDYNKGHPDTPPEGCEPQYDWQRKSFPNCNTIHETDLLSKARTLNRNSEPDSILLARGGYRDVWLVEDSRVDEIVAVKTLLYEHPWTERNMDRHRRDALATDRLTGSPYALDIYGYCANTGVFEFANGGTLEDAVDDKEEAWGKWDVKTKMKYAYQVAAAIADVHNIDKEGLPSMVHTDISMSQFVSVNEGVDFKINDFNRARFLYRQKDSPEELCEFYVGSNKGKFRSPEEYAYEGETEKVDVYSMGNIFYVLLTGEYPFGEMEKKAALAAIMEGKRADIPEEYRKSQDPLVQAIIKVIQMCWHQEPEKRATSRSVEQFLKPFAMSTGTSKSKHR